MCIDLTFSLNGMFRSDCTCRASACCHLTGRWRPHTTQEALGLVAQQAHLMVRLQLLIEFAGAIAIPEEGHLMQAHGMSQKWQAQPAQRWLITKRGEPHMPNLLRLCAGVQRHTIMDQELPSGVLDEWRRHQVAFWQLQFPCAHQAGQEIHKYGPGGLRLQCVGGTEVAAFTIILHHSSKLDLQQQWQPSLGES